MSEELCEKCGEPIYKRYHPALRMCAAHAHAHLGSLPPFACTSADLAAREPDHDPRCDCCDHLWSKHEFGGCTQLTARTVFSYGQLIEDTGPYVCGCREVDPMCTVPEAPQSAPTPIRKATR